MELGDVSPNILREVVAQKLKFRPICPDDGPVKRNLVQTFAPFSTNSANSN